MSDEPKFPSDLADRFQVRMPPGLRSRIADAAKASNRSMNAEIVWRLENSFSEETFDLVEKTEKKLREVFKIAAELREVVKDLPEEMTAPRTRTDAPS
jgi:hypothetical protein